MNRKRAFGAVSSLLLVVLVAGVFGATSTDSPTLSPVPQVTGTDIQILNVAPGISSAQLAGQLSISNLGVMVLNSGSSQFNFTSGFAFSPLKGFVHVNSAVLTIAYTLSTGNPGDTFRVRINGATTATVPEKIYTTGYTLTTAGLIPGQSLLQGSNLIDIGIVQGGINLSQVYLYQVRLTVEYTYLALTSTSP